MSTANNSQLSTLNYQLPTGYKQTEVGVIPEDWGVSKLSEVIDGLHSGISVNSVESGKGEYSHDKSILKTSCVSNGKFIPEECKTIIPRDLKRAKCSAKADTIIVSRMNTPALVGECGYVKKDYPDLFLPDRLWMTYHKSREQLCISWLSKLLASPNYSRTLKETATGTSGSMKNISKGSFMNTQIPLPPTKDEQEAIAGALSDADAWIESLEQLIAKKRRIKEGSMQALLTAPPSATIAMDNGDAGLPEMAQQLIMDNGQATEPSPNSQLSTIHSQFSPSRRLPGFSGEWEVNRLGQLSEMGSGGTPPTSNANYYDGKIPWVSIADMTKSGQWISTTVKNLSASGLACSAAQVFPAETVLYAMYASLGECSIAKVPMCSSQAILGIRTKAALSNIFLYYFLTFIRNQVKTMGQQGTQANLNKRMVQDFQLSLPPVAEQNAIAAILSDMDTELDALTAKLRKARQIKQGMMQELLTGKTRLV